MALPLVLNEAEFEAAQFSQSTDKLAGLAQVLKRSRPVVVTESEPPDGAAETTGEAVVVLEPTHSGRSRPRGVLHSRSRSLASFLENKTKNC